MDKLLNPDTGLMIWVIVTFLCLVAILKMFAWGPLLGAIEAREGRIKADRDKSNRRVVPASEIERLRGEAGTAHLSARNRFNAIVTDVKVEGLMAQVEMVVSDPVRLVAVVTRDAVEELELRPGMPATAIVKSTSVMVQH